MHDGSCLDATALDPAMETGSPMSSLGRDISVFFKHKPYTTASDSTKSAVRRALIWKGCRRTAASIQVSVANPNDTSPTVSFQPFPPTPLFFVNTS